MLEDDDDAECWRCCHMLHHMLHNEENGMRDGVAAPSNKSNMMSFERNMEIDVFLLVK